MSGTTAIFPTYSWEHFLGYLISLRAPTAHKNPLSFLRPGNKYLKSLRIYSTLISVPRQRRVKIFIKSLYNSDTKCQHCEFFYKTPSYRNIRQFLDSENSHEQKGAILLCTAYGLRGRMFWTFYWRPPARAATWWQRRLRYIKWEFERSVLAAGRRHLTFSTRPFEFANRWGIKRGQPIPNTTSISCWLHRHLLETTNPVHKFRRRARLRQRSHGPRARLGFLPLWTHRPLDHIQVAIHAFTHIYCSHHANILVHTRLWIVQHFFIRVWMRTILKCRQLST